MTYRATIEIPQKSLTKWNDLLNSDNLDYDKLEFPEISTVKCWNAKFPNGFEVDLKVNTATRKDGDLYAEMVLFDESGNQMDYTEPQYELDGPVWNLYCGDDIYEVAVFPKD